MDKAREQLEDAIAFYTTCQKYGGDDLMRLIVNGNYYPEMADAYARSPIPVGGDHA